MIHQVACSHCGKQYQAPDTLLGKKIRCKACGEMFRIPGPDENLQAVLVDDGDADGGYAEFGHHEGGHHQTVSDAPQRVAKGPRNSDEIDYEIFGSETQYCEITLDPGEQVLAEAGAMMFMTDGIEMQSVFGDPSRQSGGFVDKVFSAGKRVLTGESLFMTTFTNQGHARGKVAFGSPYPGRMIPMHLDELGGEIICQKNSFLCGARGTKLDIAFQKRIAAGLFGGEGFVMQRLTGDGIVIVHAGGTMMHHNLKPGEKLRLDTGCLMAVGPTVNYDIEFVGGLKNAFFGGEGLLLATVIGPGPVWLQSLPFSRLAGRVMTAAPGTKGKSVGEGSLLGGLGDMIMGD